MIAIKTLVSIVTVSYNSEKTIDRTIESVLNQTYSFIEYIIIDGASTDATVAIAKSYSDAFRKKSISLKIISEEDAGIYDAMNKGISMSSGDVVGIINSDDWYETDAVSKVVEVYKKQRFDLFYADLKIHKRGKALMKKSKDKKWLTTRNWNHPTTFVRREIYNSFRYACKTIYDDWDFVLRVRRSGAKISVLNEVIANFQFGGISNKKELKKVWERIKIKYNIYRENGYPRIFWLDCFAIEMMKYILS